MDQPIKILIVEDRVTDAELALREIKKSVTNFVFERVETEKEYVDALSRFQPDLVLSDYNLPTFDGMRALSILKDYSPFTPIIIWTGSTNEEIAVDCMKAGAVNYVIKENVKRLGSAVIHALEEKKIKPDHFAQEKKAREMQSQLEATVNAIPDPLFEVGLSGKYYDYHSPRTELLAVPVGQILNTSIQETLPPNVSSIIFSAMQEANLNGFSNGKQFELNLPIGKHWFELSVSRKPMDKEEEPRFIILSRDITGRKKTEEDLEKSNAFNISVFDSLSEHIAVLDESGIIIAVNDTWKRFAIDNSNSDTLQDFIGLNYLEICEVNPNYPKDETIDLLAVNNGIKSVIDGSLKEYNIEYPWHSPTEKRWFLMHISPRLGEKGAVVAHLNITQRKLLEEQKETLIRELTLNNSDLLQFSYIVSHNLRSPVSNLMGLLSLLEDIDISDENLASILSGFRLSTSALNQTLKDLHRIIVIRQQTSVDLEDIDLYDMVEHVRSQINNLLIQTQPDIEIDFSKQPTICFNKPYMESILLNLLTNAMKYRSSERELKILIFTKDIGLKNQLVFSDNGLGIDLDRYRDRIFGLYQKFHDHPESKGFGLYLIKSQVEALGGTIHVESAVNVGTQFIINFPKVTK
jgi:signal transduction histidine kinase/FixJ family two-component response regulator